MKNLLMTIKPETAFASILKGDTLFGQSCWAIIHLFGEQRLNQLLANYDKKPFMIISDPFPSGYLPKPILPSSYTGDANLNASERKLAKKNTWISIDDFNLPLNQWKEKLKSEAMVISETLDDSFLPKQMSSAYSQPHNTINRQTNSTGGGEFSPFQLQQYWHYPNTELDIYIVFDEELITPSDLQKIIEFCGQTGYGKEASTGLGKYAVKTTKEIELPKQSKSNAWLTLAPVVPQVNVAQAMANDNIWQKNKCYYQTFTRFGRHGDQMALSGQPFKNPILMAQTAAVLTPKVYSVINYTGQAIGGVAKQFGVLSKAMSNTVHQGYAPVLNIRLQN